MEKLVLPLIGAVGGLYLRLPESLRGIWVAALAGVLGLIGFRRKVIEFNLEVAFPDERPVSRARVREAYRHFARLALEIPMLIGGQGAAMRSFALAQQLTGLENWERARSRGKGVIFLSSHVGNWEVMAAVGAAKHGMDLMLVTKHLKPEWLHRAIERGRQASSVRATYEPRTLSDVLRHLRGGGTVGFVLDQFAGPPVGMRVPFLGVTVGTPTIVAMLARRTGAAIVPVVNARDAEGRFTVEVSPELELPPSEEVRLGADTAILAARVEKDVRRFPGQWLWTHRRFKGDLSPLRPGEWDDGRPRRA